jgi:serpin B
MLAPGARGRTADEITTALHSGLSADRFAAAMGRLGRTAQQQAAADKNTLRVSDTVWLQRGFGVRQEYLKTLAAAFDTGVRVTDFQADPQRSRRAVNTLVEQQTDGWIKNLLGPNAIDNWTKLVLTDALYLKADWAQGFEKKQTHDAPFHLANGSTHNVPTMWQKDWFRYASAPGWQAVELPYVGGRLAMDIVLPEAGGLEGFRKDLDAPRLDGILGALRETDVDLSLPGFAFDTTSSLVDPLRGLGIKSAFEPSAADFGGIPTDPKTRLSVSAAAQKVHITVNEAGTTAAAATGFAVEASSARAPGPTARMRVDRPFLFLIRDTRSGLPLFLGQVTDPR